MPTRDELYEKARDAGLDVNSNTKKADLEEALEKADISVDDSGSGQTDQDGNVRTEGKSYGVSADNPNKESTNG